MKNQPPVHAAKENISYNKDNDGWSKKKLKLKNTIVQSPEESFVSKFNLG